MEELERENEKESSLRWSVVLRKASMARLILHVIQYRQLAIDHNVNIPPQIAKEVLPAGLLLAQAMGRRVILL